MPRPPHGLVGRGSRLRLLLPARLVLGSVADPVSCARMVGPVPLRIGPDPDGADLGRSLLQIVDPAACECG